MTGFLARNRLILLAYAGVAILLLITALFSPGFLAPSNIRSTLVLAAFVGIVAFGQAFVIIGGGIDLSIPWVLYCAALLLRLGMTATAQIVTQEVEGALVVPNAALRYAPPQQAEAQGFSITNLFIPRMPRFQKAENPPTGGERSLWVLDNGLPRQVTVRTGVSDGSFTEIVSGDLKEGMKVIVAARQAAK